MTARGPGAQDAVEELVELVGERIAAGALARGANGGNGERSGVPEDGEQ